MASTEQVEPNELASEWIIKAMASAELSAMELSRRSKVPVMTIHNIIHKKQKRGCRVDILFILIGSCGFAFRDFENVVKPL